MSVALTLVKPSLLPSLFEQARHGLWMALEALGAWLLADFITGLVHWWEDAYAQAEWPVLGPLVAEPNLLHHRDPRAMTRLPWWKNVDVPVAAGGIALGVLAAFHALSWPLVLAILLAAFTNLVHRWAHQSPAENGRVISWMQEKGLIQSRAQHALHHRWPRKTHYCPLTNALNPVLERVGFWRGLERLILRLTGLRRRKEPKLDRAA